MKPKIVVYYAKDDIPFKSKRALLAHSDLFFTLKDRGADARLAPWGSFDGIKGFHSTKIFTKDRVLEEAGSFSPDVVFDKSTGSSNDFASLVKINKKELEALCNDKLATLQLFQDVSPASILVERASDLPKALRGIPTNLKVFKPIRGFGGQGICIGSDTEIENHADTEDQTKLFPALIQEFIDSSGGIPGLVDCVHDIRAIVVNGSIAQLSIRTPEQGKLLANVQQGGAIRSVPIEKLPKAMESFCKRVDERMKGFSDRVYSVDMIHDGDNFILMELNSRPGWQPLSASEDAHIFLDCLADMLVASVGTR